MFELNQLEQLVTIAKEGTLSKAAETLLISQPALTRSIQKLEDELQIKLFDRKKNKIILNENGKLAVEYAEKILMETNTMVDTLHAFDRSKRTISIGSCAPAPIWALNKMLHNLHPEMKLTDEINSNNKELIEGLANHQYSIIVLSHPIETELFTSIPLFEENLYLSVPPAHPLALFNEISFEDLNGESVLLLSRIGFWNELCLKKIPNSHLLIQEDVTVFNELLKASALPNFKTNITMQTEKKQENRICIPITDQEAHVSYFAVFTKQNRKMFNSISKELQHLDWKSLQP